MQYMVCIVIIKMLNVVYVPGNLCAHLDNN